MMQRTVKVVQSEFSLSNKDFYGEKKTKERKKNFHSFDNEDVNNDVIFFSSSFLLLFLLVAL